ncbi:hypothetical protein BDAP_001404 [Binucleata daphniae]
MSYNQPSTSQNKFCGNFTTFDIAKNNDYIIGATTTNEVRFFDCNYRTNTTMQLDCMPVNVKYYPNGNKLFTTTNYTDGLGVWDTERLTKLYSYKPDHCYNYQRNISACTNEGMKIYDLRCRFHIDFVKIKECKGIDWRGYTFCAVGNDTIQFGDIRNSKKSQNIVERNVTDAKYYNETYWCIIKNQDDYFLKLENVSKLCHGNKLCVIDEKIVIPSKNKLYFYTMQEEWINEIIEASNIKEINYNAGKIYILDDEQIICKNIK